MIRIDRSRVEAPFVLRRGVKSPADREHEKAKVYYADFESHRQRGGFAFTAYRHTSVREALQQLFHGKCAYCESPIGATQRGDIEAYRPKSGVFGASGELLPLHYWWLANEWTNLYLSCPDCNRLSNQDTPTGLARAGKGGRFPLEDETTRASVEGDIFGEAPLLLDPCADEVSEHLAFSSDGLVSGVTHRGAATIEILGLNRLGLVLARRSRATQIQGDLRTISTFLEMKAEGAAEDTIKEVVAACRDDAPYAGLCRQMIASVRSRGSEEVERVLSHSSVSDAALTPVITPAHVRKAKATQSAYQREQENYSLEDSSSEAIAAYVSARDRSVETVSVQNLRAIGRLSFTIADRGEQAPWLMLLGDNSTGKSTVLQAIALALVGDHYFDRVVKAYDLDLGLMVRQGAQFGEVSVTLSGATEPRRLRIYPDGRVERWGRGAQQMVLAYGSTRLLPRKPKLTRDGADYARIDNLFDPFAPLVDAQRWLAKADRETFEYAARAIRIALSLTARQTLVRRDDEVGLDEKSGFVPLKRLCDGYQTVIALIADILEVVLPAWKAPELAQGLVLIDEVGNHLHPSWKLRFVRGIREILPSIQVIATTHEPLCLRGLRDGEVSLLRRGPKGTIQLVQDLPSISGLRIDQILTSEHFGLGSTLDPDLQVLFDRYQLLLRKTRRTAAEDQEAAALRDQINQRQDLGNTERERLMLDAIDRFVAQRAGVEKDRSRQALELDAELKSLWEASEPVAVAT